MVFISFVIRIHSNMNEIIFLKLFLVYYYY